MGERGVGIKGIQEAFNIRLGVLHHIRAHGLKNLDMGLKNSHVGHKMGFNNGTIYHGFFTASTYTSIYCSATTS